jgi:hypothetical protein
LYSDWITALFSGVRFCSIWDFWKSTNKINLIADTSDDDDDIS